MLLSVSTNDILSIAWYLLTISLAAQGKFSFTGADFLVGIKQKSIKNRFADQE
jgi:hypothetical protein